jgi:hypothetical protein
MIDIFLTGHGWTATKANRSIGEFLIPEGVVLYFYCPRDKVFDDSWEDEIVELLTVEDGYRFVDRTRQDRDAPEIERLRHDQLCPESILARPGSLATRFAFKDTRELTTNGSPESCSITGLVQNKDVFAVKDKDNCYAFLSAILRALSEKALQQNETIRVHWCACRSNLAVNETSRVIDGEVLEQWRGQPKKARQPRDRPT